MGEAKESRAGCDDEYVISDKEYDSEDSAVDYAVDSDSVKSEDESEFRLRKLKLTYTTCSPQC